MSWSNKALETLLIALCFQANEGNRADGKFKPQAWVYAQKEVQKVFGTRPVSIEQCKSKIDTCKKEWQIWAQLRQQSGFSVVDDQVVADDEVLADYFMAHPKAEKYKDQVILFEDMQRELFEGYYATGESASTIDALLDLVEDDDSLFISSTDVDSGNESPYRKRPAALMLRREKRAKKTAEDRMGTRIEDMTRQISELATAMAPRDY
jgi:hypothetical protein